MKEHTLQATFHIYETDTELPQADQTLLAHAREALGYAYAPYSGFRVGVAAQMANGDIINGSNYENAAYPLCICAEQSVLASAASRYPGVSVTALAVVVKSAHKTISVPAAPCGGCRQVICETEHKNQQDIRVILQGETGPVYVFQHGRDLLPLAFSDSYL
ncbi:MAG: cytidine deaminase [Bacteroidetes bacterium]|nr:MAG: cytidine deaminase [Bacteroidota bacterium]